ncbi:MAG: YfhO family protein [Bacteroidales bacterium]|nr:YfhO family protein [Bacteroidales bacterium]
MEKFTVKRIWPYIAAIVLFLTLTLIYFSPILEGKKLKQTDIANWRGMSKEIIDFRDSTGQEALWTNSMFGGMPAYQISTIYQGAYMKTIDRVFLLGLLSPIKYVFLYLLGFYILLLILRVNPWLAVLGAIGFAFSSYFFIIIEAGHNSKAHALGYIAPVLGGIILAYRGKYFWGAALTALFLALELSANHPQLTYYLFLIVVIFGIAQFIESVQKNQLPHFFKASLVLVIAAILAVGANISGLWATWEYGKYTIRGKSELSSEKENRTSGLDIDYATQWSYGIPETFTLLIPDFMGGASGKAPSENSKTFEELKRVVPGQANQYLQYFSMYWGKQPFTSGPVYVGAVMIFLFVLGLIVVKGKYKWWLLTATILSILLSWGKNFMPLTEFFLHYMPAYNKFRAVSMTLVIANVAIPILGILALKELIERKADKKKNLKDLGIALGLTGGLILFIMAFAGSIFSFSASSDNQLLQAWFPQNLISALEQDRLSLLRTEGLRSLIFILLTGLAIWAVIAQKVKKEYAFMALILLVTIDMWTVSKRYLNSENFVNANKVEKPFTPTAANLQILQDKDPNFRVLNKTVSAFNDASTSYFHKSIGGYHGAKLRRYQDLIDYHISQNNMNVLNMLNTKYFIVPGANGQPQAQYNPQALGNAWAVKSFRIVNNADEEIEVLNNFDPAREAIIDKSFAKYAEGFKSNTSTDAVIILTNYQPNKLVYNFSSSAQEMLVFSEIYYDKGWNVYVDGEKQDYFRANYILRAMIVPAGTHEIIWEFEPDVYYTGGIISTIASIIILLLFFAGLALEMKKNLGTAQK